MPIDGPVPVGYAVLVDDEELTDVDILDITNPFAPVLVNEMDLDLPPFDVDQPTPSNLTSTFSHDMVVEKIGQRYVMSVNYWDGGYVLLDITDPRQVQLIAESDYANLDEERLARGHAISPEGNAHQSELSPNRKFLIGTDEDFNPYRVTPTITSGPYAGTVYKATSARATPPIVAGTSVSGTPTFRRAGLCSAGAGQRHRPGRAGGVPLPAEARRHQGRRLHLRDRVQLRPVRLLGAGADAGRR